MMDLTTDRRMVRGAALATVALPGLAQGEGNDRASQEPTDMRVSLTLNGMTVTATLYDNPSARDFYSMLPLDLTIKDFSTNEKIVYLPRKLTEERRGPFGNEQPGDLCYYIPWGNLALYYGNYTYGSSLIRLGRFDSFEPMLMRGEFPVRIE
jgi:hypothetical protein